MKSIVIFFAIAILGATCDIASKDAVFAKTGKESEIQTDRFFHDKDKKCQWCRLGDEKVIVVEKVLQFHTTLNSGIVFGWFKDVPGAERIFLWISLVAIPLIIWLFFSYKKRHGLLVLSLGLILAGTCGNMYDRLRHGAVRDFIDAFYGYIHWPLFNIADACICSGVLFLAVYLFFVERKYERARQEDESYVGTSTTVASETEEEGKLPFTESGDNEIPAHETEEREEEPPARGAKNQPLQ